MFLYMPEFILSHSKRIVQDAVVSAVKRSLRFKVIQVSVSGLCSSRLFDGNAKIPDLY